MIDLANTTILIPLQIDHPDRYNNAKTVLLYLNKHFNTNVMVYEVSNDGQTRLDFITQLSNLHVKHYTQQTNGTFHRTRYLNKMLNEAVTPVIVNHDVDILLKPETYVTAQNLILEDKLDVVYPYEFGDNLVLIEKSLDRDGFLKTLDLDQIDSIHTGKHISHRGHCIFFNREVYWEGGAENENFISWGPEDQERANRFKKLDYRVDWLPGAYVYHFEHHRSIDSSSNHSHGHHNSELWNTLATMSKEELLHYYRNQEYLKQYDNILHPKQEQFTVPQDEYTINS